MFICIIKNVAHNVNSAAAKPASCFQGRSCANAVVAWDPREKSANNCNGQFRKQNEDENFEPAWKKERSPQRVLGKLNSRE
jgi:hypothetical protein